MPRLAPSSGEQVFTIPGTGNFQFSAARIENLGATEYTLVTIALDTSGSVESFKNDLQKFVNTVIESCRKSPRANNLMIRFITFNHNVHEIHGFKELSSLDPSQYKIPMPDGWTALFAATYDSVGATLTYAEHLIKQDFLANGCVYIITDGMNNKGGATESMIAQLMQDATNAEKIESLITILIGLHDPTSGYSQEVTQALQSFKKNANITEFVDVGAATPQRLAKLAGFVSQSISSTSQVLGSGAPSQPPSVVF